MIRFYIKYLQDIRSQLGRGGETYKGEKATPGIPANIAPGRRVCQEARVDWGAAIVLLPYYLFLYDGDIRPFRDLYPNMKEFLRYVERYESADGIIRNGYGDWCPPGGNDRMECPPELTSTALYFRMLDILSAMADTLNDHGYALRCAQTKDTVRQNFNRKFLVDIAGTDAVGYGSQTADVMAYRFGLVPQEKLDPFTRGLIQDINQLHSGHISTGIHGQRHLYTVLCDLGLDDLAYKLMIQPTFPSLAYTLSCDQTTWPEEPREYKNRKVQRTSSFNHPMQSGFAAFFHESVGGIQPDAKNAGFKHFQLRPYLFNNLKWAKSYLESVQGGIHSAWKVRGNTFEWDITIPCNTTATVFVPATTSKAIMESGKPVKEGHGVHVMKNENSRCVMQLGSGTYHITSFLPGRSKHIGPLKTKGAQ